MRAVRAQQPLGAQDRGDTVRHAVARIGLQAGRVPQMLRHEFQGQRLGGRPGQGGSGRRQRPGLEIGEIGGEGPKTVLAHPFLGEMLEGRDVLVGQNLGEAIAPVHRQDRRQSVEFQRATRQRIAGQGRGGGFTHPAPPSRLWTKTGFASFRPEPGRARRGHRQAPRETGTRQTGVPPPMPVSGASAASLGHRALLTPA